MRVEIRGGASNEMLIVDGCRILSQHAQQNDTRKQVAKANPEETKHQTGTIQQIHDACEWDGA